MIIKYDDIIVATCKEIEEMVSMCRKHNEMFCIVVDSTNIKRNVISFRDINDLRWTRESLNAFCLSDMVLYQDDNGLREIKSRFGSFDTLMLVGNRLVKK